MIVLFHCSGFLLCTDVINNPNDRAYFFRQTGSSKVLTRLHQYLQTSLGHSTLMRLGAKYLGTRSAALSLVVPLNIALDTELLSD